MTIIDGGGSEMGIGVVGNGGGQTTISDLQVINCFSQDDGAGMIVGTANLKLIGCIFQGNQTTGYAAGILFTGSTATLNSCKFIQNNAIAAAIAGPPNTLNRPAIAAPAAHTSPLSDAGAATVL